MNPLPASLLFVTMGLALVLLARKPVRRLFGAGPAFALWLLPLLLAVVPLLPTLPAFRSIPDGIVALPVAQALVVQTTATVATTSHWLPWLWLSGCACLLARLGMHFWRLRRHGRPLPDAMAWTLRPILHELDVRCVRLHPSGPAVLWSPRCQLLLPADFLERFNADERRYVLTHEKIHMRRADPLWSLMAELTVSLLWFHPLAWLALSRFRLDQELACDETALRQMPGDHAPYARTLLRSAGMDMPPALIPWFAEPQLKERLTMIKSHHCSRRRRHSGYIALGVLLAGSLLAAQAAMPEVAASTAGIDQEGSIDLAIRQDGAVYWNGHRLTAAELNAKLAASAAERPQPSLLMHIDKDASYQSVLVVLQDAKAAGIARVGLVGAVAQAGTSVPAHGDTLPTEDLAVRMRHPPTYPAQAVRNKEEGTVVLRVLVGTDGAPRRIEADAEGTTASEKLVNAAVAAARQWRFNPGTKDGEPVENWARISVMFSLTQL